MLLSKSQLFNIRRHLGTVRISLVRFLKIHQLPKYKSQNVNLTSREQKEKTILKCIDSLVRSFVTIRSLSDVVPPTFPIANTFRENGLKSA